MGCLSRPRHSEKSKNLLHFVGFSNVYNGNRSSDST